MGSDFAMAAAAYAASPTGGVVVGKNPEENTKR